MLFFDRPPFEHSGQGTNPVREPVPVHGCRAWDFSRDPYGMRDPIGVARAC